MWRSLPLGMLGVLCWLSGSVSALTLARDLEDRNHRLLSIRWPNGIVPVCWEPGIDPQDSLPIKIRETVESAWSRHANIRFTGWENCIKKTPVEMPEGHIVFIREINKSWSELKSGGDAQDTGRAFRNFRPFPTIIDLVFDANLLCDSGPFGNTNDECVAWLAVHEFGHALGFKHEHERNDFSGCWPWDSRWPHSNGNAIKLTEYDESSTMNYCSDGAGTNEGKLSRLDIVGVQLAYGRKPAGSLVGPGGRCFDADNSNGLKPGSRVQLWDCHGGTNQQWLWSPGEGTFQLEANLKLCLDDPSGGKILHTELVLAECSKRVTKRWDFVDAALLTMGEYTLGYSRGFSVTSSKMANITYRGDALLEIGDTGNCVLTSGEVNPRFDNPLQQVRCDPTDPRQQFFLGKSGQIWHLDRGVVTCLEVKDSGLPGVGTGASIVIQECDSGPIEERKITQKFNLIGVMKGANNRLIGIDGDHFISSNGLPLRTERIGSSNSRFIRYYFGRTIVNGLD